MLIRGDIVFTSKLTDSEAEWLLETIQSFYLNDVRFKLVERFNKEARNFEFKDVLRALSMPLLWFPGGLQAFQSNCTTEKEKSWSSSNKIAAEYYPVRGKMIPCILKVCFVYFFFFSIFYGCSKTFIFTFNGNIDFVTGYVHFLMLSRIDESFMKLFMIFFFLWGKKDSYAPWFGEIVIKFLSF